MSSTTTPSEILDNILKDDVGKDDPLWKEYLDKAAAFDVRMVDEWNKIVDVLLVYVALFISVLTSFAIQTLPHFQRNPADITNDLLVAIYNQLLAQSNNTSIPPVDPRSYFKQPIDNYDSAVVQNALLYTSLSLSIIVSAIALVAKLWLVNYSRQVFSVGSPYDRAMKRQEAYNGVLVWNLGGVINMLPIILLIALYLFGIYVYTSVYAVHDNIGKTIGALLSVGVLFLGFSSLGGAFVPGCPFRSGFSSVMQLIFEKFDIPWTSSKRIMRAVYGCFSLQSKWLRLIMVADDSLRISWFIFPFVLLKGRISGTWISLAFFPAAIPIAYLAQEKGFHKPQKYKISHLAAWAFLFLVWITFFFYFQDSLSSSLRLLSSIYFTIGSTGSYISFLMISGMSKSMADTGEIDAIAWLLITAPPQHPATFFKKVGQLTGRYSIGSLYRPRLLESLMPLLTLLITSYHAPEPHTSDTHSSSSEPRRNFKIELKREQSDDVLDGRYRLPTSLSLVDDDTGPMDEDPHLKNLEIYTACLAQLSQFTDWEGSFYCLWEDAMQHPKLEQQLIDKLVKLANPRYGYQVGLSSAAEKVLKNYQLDIEGKPVTCPATVVWSIATVLRNASSKVATALKSAFTLILKISRRVLNRQEQGDPDLHRPVELQAATPIEPPLAHLSRERQPEIKGSGIC